MKWHLTFGLLFFFLNLSVTYFNLPVQTQYSVLQYILFMVEFFPPCYPSKTLFLPLGIYLIFVLKQFILRLRINIMEKFCYPNEYRNEDFVGLSDFEQKIFPLTAVKFLQLS